MAQWRAEVCLDVLYRAHKIPYEFQKTDFVEYIHRLQRATADCGRQRLLADYLKQVFVPNSKFEVISPPGNGLCSLNAVAYGMAATFRYTNKRMILELLKETIPTFFELEQVDELPVSGRNGAMRCDEVISFMRCKRDHSEEIEILNTWDDADTNLLRFAPYMFGCNVILLSFDTKAAKSEVIVSTLTNKTTVKVQIPGHQEFEQCPHENQWVVVVNNSGHWNLIKCKDGRDYSELMRAVEILKRTDTYPPREEPVIPRDAGSSSGQWECAQCTMLNEAHNAFCSMCMSDRP